ncbi:MAG: tetratricopeptide repeat protein, partial [Candidatus Lustribacter sp.]
EAALAAFTRATRLQPGLASAFSSQALALQLLSRPPEAKASVKQALSLDPTDAVALKVLAKCQLHKGQLEAAKQTCQLIVQQNAGNANALQTIEEMPDDKEKARRAHSDPALWVPIAGANAAALAEALEALARALHSVADDLAAGKSERLQAVFASAHRAVGALERSSGAARSQPYAVPKR